MTTPSENPTSSNFRRVPPSPGFGDPTGAGHLDGLVSTLKPEVQERLDLLTRVADLLGIDDLAFSSYASAIIRLSAREQDSRQGLNRLILVECELQNHLATTMHEERLIESWMVRLDQDLAAKESMSVIQNRREAMLKKAKEYRTLLEAISTDTPAITFETLMAQQTANEHKMHSIKEKHAQVKAFKGLPPNLALARQQLKSARAAQMELIQLRERLLGQMAASVI
ncbi:PCI domain-containing protein [Mycena sanguinolenta]|uniref:PCI domain-containing protein n=1 Tax=Mycena sanguinolenta TaxID=230812 RepID=A0A8H6YVA1_9AGAR|nr:PCI domain-containing protein [Mycena sanguinolenta]